MASLSSPCIAAKTRSDVFQAPNYVDPETRGPTLLIVETILIIITAIVVAARTYVRIVLIRNFSWDDWLILFAMVRPPCT